MTVVYIYHTYFLRNAHISNLCFFHLFTYESIDVTFVSSVIVKDNKLCFVFLETYDCDNRGRIKVSYRHFETK